MATYTYKCPDHGYFDQEMSMEEHMSEFPCPHCNEEAPQVHRNAANFNSHFEGSYKYENPGPSKF